MLKKHRDKIILKWTAILFLTGSVLMALIVLVLEPSLVDDSSFQTHQLFKIIGFCILVSLTFFFSIREISDLLKKGLAKRKKVKVDADYLISTLDKAPSPKCIFEGPNHTFTFANKSYKEVVGADELSGKKLINVLPEAAEHGYIDILDKVYKTGKPYVANNQAIKIEKDEGEEDYVFNLLYEPLKDKSGKVYGIFAEALDISDQIESNEKLEQKNYQLKAAQEIAQLGYWEYNLTSGELNWSDIIFDLYGINKESFNPTVTNFLDLVHPDDRAMLEQKMAKVSNLDCEYRVVVPSGEVRWFRAKKGVGGWRKCNPDILHGIILDITNQKKQEKRIKKSYIKGENKERKRISNELHDGIAQYLSSALLHIDDIEDFSEILKPSILKKIRNVRALVKRAVNDTRTLSRNLMPQTIKEHGLITAVELLIKQYQISSDIELVFNHNLDQTNEINKEVKTNYYRIIQELLSNAVRHSKCDKIYIKAQKQDGQLKCIIKDNGTGITNKNNDQKEGLGLQNLQDRVELLSGSIEFINKPQEGLKVTIEVPI